MCSLTVGLPWVGSLGVAEHSENRNQDTTVHIEALIESIPPFSRLQNRLNASSTSGGTEGQRRAVVDPALAAAVDHWTHFSVGADTSNMTMRHEWPVLGRKKDLPLKLHSGWTTHSRCARRERRDPASQTRGRRAAVNASRGSTYYGPLQTAALRALFEST